MTKECSRDTGPEYSMAIIPEGNSTGINRSNTRTYIHTYINVILIDHSPYVLFKANETKHSTTTAKDPIWPGANQLAIYKCSRDVEPETLNQGQIQLVNSQSVL